MVGSRTESVDGLRNGLVYGGEKGGEGEALLNIEEAVKSTDRLVGWKGDVNMVRAVLLTVETLVGVERGRWLQRDVDSRRRLDSILCVIEGEVALNTIVREGGITVGDFIHQKKFLLRRWDEQDLKVEGYLEDSSDDNGSK